MNNITTFTDFLLESQRNFPNAKGNLTLLLTQIENAGKIIASHVRESGLVDILGSTGKKNSFDEEVQKLDAFTNTLLIKTLVSSGQTYALISEEVAEPIFTPKELAGDYIVYFDPLDGSSNIDINCPIGTIFSIYHKKDGLLQKGSKQIIAGYILYGSSTMLVFTDGKTVNGFTLDPSIGSFLLSHPNITIPDSGQYYSLNEGYYEKYDADIKRYLQELKVKKTFSLRYVGALVADIHRTLLKGGIYLYPKDATKPKGKIRLMLEVNPMALLIETAGGKTTTDMRHGKSPLTIAPTHIHERSPFIAGSSKNVLEYIEYKKK